MASTQTHEIRMWGLRKNVGALSRCCIYYSYLTAFFGKRTKMSQLSWKSFASHLMQKFYMWYLIWKWKSLSPVWLFATPWTTQSMELSRPEYWSGYLSLLQGIFPTQGSNPGLPHCREILYQLSPRGSPVVADILIKINHEVEYSFHYEAPETQR